MWIGKDGTGRFHGQIGVLYEREQMIENDIMTLYDVLCGLEQILK
jgi:hypothetical protein